ncbi:MAG: tetratricopeptide repeat protein [Phycisphaerales bacterium]|nr:tetratricopeptide repeat protein [Phycisphaerales bacterium]
MLSLRRLVVPALVTIAASLTGCGQKHGEYTSAHISAAQEKMSILKSGTEWQMAQQQFLAGDLDKALKTVNRSLAINPNVPKSHVLKGRILIEKGRLEDARECLLEAEKLDDKNVDAQYYLGIVHEQFNQPADALTRYNRAADLDSANPQYPVAAAEMLVQMGKLDEAEQLLNGKKTVFQYNAAVRQSLGHIAQLRQDHAAAVRCFDEALLLAPDDSAILEDLAQAQFSAGQYAEAEYSLNRLLALPENTGRRDLRSMRAKCLVRTNRPVEARSILLEMTAATDQESVRDVASWIDLGNVCAVLKDKPNLRNAASRVIALAPDHHEGYTLRAMYLRLDGKTEESLSAIEEAVARCGNDVSPMIFRAAVLQDLGRPFDARQCLQDALSRNPNSQPARNMLARLESQLGGQQPTTVTSGENTNQ